MKRLAALVAAIAMVAGAWAVRSMLGEDDGGSGDGDVPEQLRLLCATELADACTAFAGDDVTVRSEDPGLTADRLAGLPAGDDPGFDAWLVDGPWAAMVDDDRDFAKEPGEVLGEQSDVLVRSPAVIVLRTEQQASLADVCGEAITWTCIGEQAAALQVGVSPPDRGDGLVPLAEAVGSYFGATDYSADQFEDPAFTTWFDELTLRSRSGTVRLGTRSALEAATSQTGTFNVVGALEAQATTLLRGRDGWRTLYPDPMSTADVQLVPRSGLDAGKVLDQLGRERLVERLVARGWRPATEPGDPPIDGTGLPGAGTLNALRDLW